MNMYCKTDLCGSISLYISCSLTRSSQLFMNFNVKSLKLPVIDKIKKLMHVNIKRALQKFKHKVDKKFMF